MVFFSEDHSNYIPLEFLLHSPGFDDRPVGHIQVGGGGFGTPRFWREPDSPPSWSSKPIIKDSPFCRAGWILILVGTGFQMCVIV